MSSFTIRPFESQVGIGSPNIGRGSNHLPKEVFTRHSEANNLGRGIASLGASISSLSKDISEKNKEIPLSLLEEIQNFQMESDKKQISLQDKFQGNNAHLALEEQQKWTKERVNELLGIYGKNPHHARYIIGNIGSDAISKNNSLLNYGQNEKNIAFANKIKADWDRVLSIASNPEHSRGEVLSASKNHNILVRQDLERQGYDEGSINSILEANQKKIEETRTVSDILQFTQANPQIDTGYILRGSASPSQYASRLESGSLGSKAIGESPTDGLAFGKFQIAEKPGTLGAFFDFLEGKGLVEEAQGFMNASPKEKKQQWEKLVNSGKLDGLEEEFIQQTHIQPALQQMPPEVQSFILSHPSLESALWSTAIQHGAGGAGKLISKAFAESNGDPSTFITALYESRKTQFPSSSEGMQKSLASRFDQEKKELLQGLGEEGTSNSKHFLPNGLDPSIAHTIRNMPLAARLALKNTADGIRKGHELKISTQRNILTQSRKQDFQKAQRGFRPEKPSKDSYIQAFGEADGSREYEIAEHAQTYQDLIYHFPDMTEKEKKEKVNDVVTLSREEKDPAKIQNIQKLLLAEQLDREAREQDPIQYISQRGNDREDKNITAPYEAFMTMPLPTNEEEKIALEQKRATYVTSVGTKLEHLGIKDKRIVSNQYIDDLATSLNQAKNPQELTAILEGESARWGDEHWLTVAQQLGRSEKISPSIYSFSLLALRAKSIMANVYFESGGNIKNHNKKSIKDLNISTAEFSNALHERLEPFYRSFAGIHNLTRLDAYTDTIKALALQRMKTGLSQEAAIEEALKDTLDQRYDVQEVKVNNTSTYLRIPLHTGLVNNNGKTITAKELGEAAELFMANFGGVFDEPRSVRDPLLSQFSDSKKEGVVEHSIRNNGYWQTKEDDTGVYMLINGSIAQDEDGKEIFFTWAEVWEGSKKIDKTIVNDMIKRAKQKHLDYADAETIMKVMQEEKIK